MKRIFPLILSIVSTVVFASNGIDRDAIRAVIERQMTAYPQSTLMDYYKNLFQDAFGPGHLIGENDDAEASARNYLLAECKAAKGENDLHADYEPTGIHGRFCRVNLSVVNDGRVPFDVFFAAFMQSARRFVLPSVAEWAKEWKEISRELRKHKRRIANFDADCAAIDAMLAAGKYVVHHSKQYSDAYHPHYRLIETSIFEQQIKPLLQSKTSNNMKKQDLSVLGNEDVFKLIGEEWMLVTAGTNDKFNTMTASWGGFGWLWNKPVAFIFIRPERYTHDFIEQNDRLTLSFYDEDYRKALQICGTKSGRDIDKVKAANLTPQPMESGTMTFAEARMTLDCRKLFKTEMTEASFIDKETLARWYNNQPDGSLHTIYVVEIEGVYTNEK